MCVCVCVKPDPVGCYVPQHHGGLSNGTSREAGLASGPKVYGVVQSNGDTQEQEVMAREWPVNHLRDEMKYFREVRDLTLTQKYIHAHTNTHTHKHTHTNTHTGVIGAS